MWCCARRSPPHQAEQAGHSLDDELHLLTVHGVLHLLGYDHAEPAEEREMFRLQNELLDTWRDHRAALARQARLAAVDAAVLDTVGLADVRSGSEPTVPSRAGGADPQVDSMDVLLLVLAAALVPIAGVLAAADAAITMVSPARVEELDREGRRGAASLRRITEDRPRYTNLLLLLRTGRGDHRHGDGGEGGARAPGDSSCGSGWRWSLVMVVVTYVAIGVLPRTLGRQHPYTVGLALAGPTRGLAKVLSPVASLLILIGNAITPGRGFREGPFSSDIELRELVDIAGSRGVVEETEREMLQSVFDLGDTIVREVMVPRTEVVWIEETRPFGRHCTWPPGPASPASRSSARTSTTCSASSTSRT